MENSESWLVEVVVLLFVGCRFVGCRFVGGRRISSAVCPF
jgi:hypothetical protein